MFRKYFLALLLISATLLCACAAKQAPNTAPKAPVAEETKPAPQETPPVEEPIPAPQETPPAEEPIPAPQETPSAEEPIPAPQETPSAEEPAPTQQEDEPKKPANPTTNTPSPPEEPAPSEADTSDSTGSEEASGTEAVPPRHSPMYIPDCTLQQITEYFDEVVLDVEYTDGTGDATLVQKWLAPLYYRIYGTATDTDMQVLLALFEQLNAVPGFPGIYAAEEGFAENLSLHFLEPSAFHDSFSAVINGEDAYGAVQFWYYTASNELYTARIGYRTDIDQVTRNSILLEEIINALGISDTILRTDSITYQYSNETTSLSAVDWTIVKLLYDPSIQCGMNAAECAAILETLYY